MVYRYNVSIELSGTIYTTRQLTKEELELAIEKVLSIPRTDWPNVRFGPNYTPENGEDFSEK